MQVERVLDGAGGVPFNSVATGVSTVGGIEREVVVSGTATSYRLRGAHGYAAHGRWDAEPASPAPFRTRLLIERPASPDACNGTAIVFWNNVSAGHDLFLTHDQIVPIVRDGFAVVAVSAQRVGVHGWGDAAPAHALTDPPAGLRDWDPDRYGELEQPGDQFSYDIFTQGAELVRGGILGDVDVRHVVAMGASQSASRLATYANAIQPLTSTFDAFVLLVYHGFGAVLDAHDEPPGGVPEMGLLPAGAHRLRDDLAAPILVVNSEFEAARFDANWQPDHDRLRWWEFAGAAHCGLQAEADMRAMLADLAGVIDLDRLNYTSFLPAIRGATRAVRRWIEDGTAPPAQPRLRMEGTPPRIPRDEHGNAVGGIRTPEVEAPLATYLGALDPADARNQMGAVIPFPPDTLRALYRDHADWLGRYSAATQRLVDAGIFVADDAEHQIARAAAAPFPTAPSPA